jgi:hypothetical protein
VLRIAFTPTKFRLAIEPEPFVLEIDTREDPWTLVDVTDDLATAGEQAAQEHTRRERQKLEDAAQALVTQLQYREASDPLGKEAAVKFLQDQGVTQRQARKMLEDGFNADVHPGVGRWHLRSIPGGKSHAIGVQLAGVDKRDGKNDQAVSTSEIASKQVSLPVIGPTPYDAKTMPSTSSNGTDLPMPSSRHMQTSQRREEDPVFTSIEAGDNGVPLPVVTQPTPDDTCPCVHEHVGVDAGQSICLDCRQVLVEEDASDDPL